MNATTARDPRNDDATPPVDIWFDAQVWCTDGDVGTVTGIVCSSVATHLHHIVVEDPSRPRDDHPIIRGLISSADAQGVTVDTTRAAVRGRRLPTKTVLVTRHPLWLTESGLDGPGMWMPYNGPLQVPVTVPELANGDVLVRAHAAVYAEGHRIGWLAGLRADPTTGMITGAIIDVGHLWHHHHVLVPAPDIEELADATVWIRSSRDHVRHLPVPTESDTGRRSVTGRTPRPGHRRP
jgi:hypothetical protein